jgi:PAS domain S-box-containing protein
MKQSSTILIVDDDPGARQTLEALLFAEGYELAFASNGSESLTKAAELTPDLILLDVMMPDTDGFEVCRQLRTNPQLAEVPVIMVTALDDRDSRLQGIEAGADDFISKPFDRAELRARVRTITRLNRYRTLLLGRANFERMIELSPDGIMVVDIRGVIRLANSEMLRILGAGDRDELIGKEMTSFIMIDKVDEYLSYLHSAISEMSRVDRMETTVVNMNGESVHVEVSAGHFVYEEKPAAQFIFRDITRRKLAQEALQESESRLRAIFEAATDVGFVMTDLEGIEARIMEFSPGAKNIFGYSRDEVVGKPLSMLHIPEDTSEILTMFHAIRKCKQGFTGEWTMVRKSGEQFPSIYTTHPMMDTDGNVIAFLSACMDITDRKEMEEALQESEDRFRKLSEAAEEGIAIHDKGVILAANQTLAEMFGYEVSELTGMSAEKLVTPESWEMVMAFAIANENPDPAEAVGIRKDGSTSQCQLMDKPYQYHGGSVRAMLFRNIPKVPADERKRLM